MTKLDKARPPLYRHQSLQLNIHCAAFFDIYKAVQPFARLEIADLSKISSNVFAMFFFRGVFQKKIVNLLKVVIKF